MARRKARRYYPTQQASAGLPPWAVIALVAPLAMVFIVIFLTNQPSATALATPTPLAWTSSISVKDGMVEILTTVNRPQDLSTATFRVEAGNKEYEVCAVPLTGRQISCRFDPRSKGISSGTTIRGRVVVNTFTGAVTDSRDLGTIRWESSETEDKIAEWVYWLALFLALSLSAGGGWAGYNRRRKR